MNVQKKQLRELTEKDKNDGFILFSIVLWMLWPCWWDSQLLRYEM